VTICDRCYEFNCQGHMAPRLAPGKCGCGGDGRWVPSILLSPDGAHVAGQFLADTRLCGPCSDEASISRCFTDAELRGFRVEVRETLGVDTSPDHTLFVMLPIIPSG
jgi:hypothetical protein